MAISLSACLLALQLLDLLADGAGFFLGIPGAGDGDFLAKLVVGAQRLAEPAFVVGDDVGGGGEDVAGGAVIAFQTNDRGAGKVVLEAQDVVDLGAAPAVDRLIVVADAADVFGDAPLPPCGWRPRAPAPRRGEGWGEGAPALRSSCAAEPPHPPRFARRPLPLGRGGCVRSSSAPAAAATDTAPRWCPDIRPPG